MVLEMIIGITVFLLGAAFGMWLSELLWHSGPIDNYK